MTAKRMICITAKPKTMKTDHWEQFETRIRSASIAKRNLPFVKVNDDIRTVLLSRLLRQSRVNPDRVIYIHIPFCNNVCSFCIYHKQKNIDNDIVAGYCKTIINQIDALSSTIWVKSDPFKAVYFGGGTPTSVPVEYLESIINSLKNNYSLTADCEITVESTISELTPAYVMRLKNAGVNRISLGVQTFDEALRKSLGRSAGRKKIADTIGYINSVGISNVCVDLIYNLEGQDYTAWKNDLAFLKTTSVTGCSVYPLILNGRNIISNISDLKENIRKEYEYFIEADDTLEGQRGWERFTSVQFGHSIYGKAVYVISQGQSADLLAFGSGAGGRIGNIQYMQTNDTDLYIKSMGDFINDPVTLMTIDKVYLKLKEIYCLTESLTITKSAYRSLNEYFSDLFSELENRGLISIHSDSVSLTQNGRFWAGNISALFTERIRDLIINRDLQKHEA